MGYIEKADLLRPTGARIARRLGLSVTSERRLKDTDVHYCHNLNRDRDVEQSQGYTAMSALDGAASIQLECMGGRQCVY